MIYHDPFSFLTQAASEFMKYYRLIFKKDEGGVAFSEIIEQTVDQKTFEEMNWDKPIIRQMEGNLTHLLSISQEYLEVILLGISIYHEVNSQDV